MRAGDQTARQGGRREYSEQVHFDRLAEETGEIWWGSTTPAGVKRLRRRARLLADELTIYTNPRVLELGCGTGAFTQHILEALPDLRLEGRDISAKAIDVARRKLKEYRNAAFNTGSAVGLPYLDASFDAVVGNSILHHLPLVECAAEAYRVLKHGGLFWFSEPNMMNPLVALEKNIHWLGRWLQNSPDETAFFRWRLRKVFYDIGFRKVRVEPFDFLHPAIPRALVRPFDLLGRWLEQIPIVREITGSLLIRAAK
jgi:ubiquinone/menaquinone biosynthesis C-methylase UbiE